MRGVVIFGFHVGAVAIFEVAWNTLRIKGLGRSSVGSIMSGFLPDRGLDVVLVVYDPGVFRIRGSSFLAGDEGAGLERYYQ